MKRFHTDYIVVHHAATKASMDVGAAEIRKWHLDRGWNDIGYHFVVRRDGSVEKGRAQNDVGAHVKGFNSRSVGICLVGGLGADGTPENNYTAAQMSALGKLVHELKNEYRTAVVVGHRDLDPAGKPHCPMFDVKAWWQGAA